MKVLLLGATGLVGRALCLRLARDGHELIAWVRNLETARGLLGSDVELVAAGEGDASLREVVARSEAVINLAGAPIARRWTDKVRAEVRASRVGLDERLVQAMAACDPRPRTLIAASAVGIYGNRGDELLDEGSSLGDGWLAQLCREWEASAQAAEPLGVRVAMVRIGIVLAGDGGALAALMPTAKLGLGAVLGSGKQYMSWIELLDLVDLFATALVDERYVGAIDGTAPNPVTNRELTRALASALGRPQLFRAPAFVLKLALGEAAQVVLDGQRVLPKRALELGFRFRHAEIGSAFAELVHGRVPLDIRRVERWPSSGYLEQRHPRWKLETQVRLATPLPEVLEFFGHAENLGAMTRAGMGFAIIGDSPAEIVEGTTIDYRVQLGRLSLRWRTRIDRVDAKGFADSQMRGPYHAWYHEHEFVADGEGTLMTDRVWYSLPLGSLGAIAHPFYVAPQLREIFHHRTRCAVARFGQRQDD